MPRSISRLLPRRKRADEQDTPVLPPAGPPPDPANFLEVRGLTVHFPTDDGLVRSVDGIDFALRRGRTLGIVGESGSGKSVTSLAVMGLHEHSNARIGGEIWLDGQEIVRSTPEQVRLLRGRRMAMIFQDPMSSMHPFYTVGHQIIEAYRVHNDVTVKQARAHAIDLLGRVGIPRPDRRVDDHPHHFSGGMRQRAMIAMALSCDPELLIADEPTTALDVTVQAQILDLIRDLQREFDSAVVMITHDLGVVAELADDVLVMYAGRAVEHGAARTLFEQPRHPYTWGLLGSLTRLDRVRQDRLMPIKGSPPSLISLPSGCAFRTRCPYADRNDGRERTEVPELVEIAPGHRTACHLDIGERERIWTRDIGPRL